MSSTKEITESLGFGVVFATIKAVVDYASGKKVTLYSAGKNTVILPPLREKPKLSDFYSPSRPRKDAELALVVGGMAVVGILSYKLL